MKKCTNCNWEGEKDNRPYNICPNCGDNLEVIGKTKIKEPDQVSDVNLDLNGDGVIDSKDATIASKVMNAVRSSKKKSSKKKKSNK